MDPVIAELRSNPYLAALAVMAASIVVAYIVELFTVRVLLRLTRHTKTEVDDKIVAALRRPLFASVVAWGAWIALARIAPTPTAGFISRGVLLTIVIILWMQGTMRMGKVLLGAVASRAGRSQVIQRRTQPLFEMILAVLLFGGAAYGVLLAWKVDVTAWLASAGILGIAIGFAAKDTLSNLFSGIFILVDAPYKIGDFVVLDSQERGEVTDIGIRSTRILTRDDIQIIVPNAAIANAKIVNESGGHHEKERIRIKIGVAYGSDLDQVRRVLLAVAEQSEHLGSDPAPRVRFRVFGESSLNFELLGWIDEPVLRGRAIDELNTAVYKAFNREGIQIPFPQRDVHLIKK